MDSKEEQRVVEEYTIEPLKDEDIPLFIELDKKASDYEVEEDYYKNLNKYFGDSIRVARFNGEIVGAVYTLLYGVETNDYVDDPFGEIVSITVSEDAQRRGIGEKLMQFAISRLTEQKAPRIQLHTSVKNVAMQNLATKMGFVIVEIEPNTYDNDTVDGYRMVLDGYQPQDKS